METNGALAVFHKRERSLKRLCAAAACVLLFCLFGAARAENVPSGIVNVLLLGVDRNENAARAGAILILTADTVRGGIRLTNVSADLRPAEEGGTVSEIYDSDGAEGVAKALSNLLGVEIQRYVTVDRAGFSAAVDACGGVDIDLGEDEAQALSEMYGEAVSPGLRTLNGEQALCYVRIRGAGSGDRRQRVFLWAMADKALRLSSPGRILDLAERLLPYMATNLPAMDLITIAVAALTGEGGSPESCVLPGEGEYEAADGAVLLSDPEAAAERIRAFIYYGRRGR